MKILLIGAGNMGEAMIDGLSFNELLVVDRNLDKLKKLKKIYKSVNFSDKIPNIDDFFVILAIKPNSLKDLKIKGEAKGLISILAGVSIQELKQHIKAKYIIRAMPNIAAIKKKSTTILCGDHEMKEEAIQILKSIGSCFWLNSEDELDIAMGLASCAPAWIAMAAEALSDGAVNLGLKRDISYKLVSSMLQGTGDMLNNEYPAVLKDKITSPKGTTIAGLKTLENAKLRSAFMKAVNKAYKRARK